MSNSGDFRPIPAAAVIGHSLSQPTGSGGGGGDPRVPLLNLSTVRSRMDSVQRFLHESVNNNTVIGADQMEIVSTEISSAIHQIIVNGAALLAFSQSQSRNPNLSAQLDGIASKHHELGQPVASTSSILNKSIGMKLSESDLKFTFGESDSSSKTPICLDVEDKKLTDLKVEMADEDANDDWDIIELDAVELLAEHIHFCDICGKGFKRDANLRMHMRAHGNQFKTPEALVKPEKCEDSHRRTRFSCPYSGCNRNKSHKKFRPLKSVICVKNHFKRSHCPKMYSCDRCNKKCFSVVADLKSHLKHCGEAKWKCSCGTSFSRKDKLFGHMALFEGHMPAVMEDDEKGKAVNSTVEDEDDEDRIVKDVELAQLGANCPENAFFDGLFEGFGSIENFCLQDLLDSPNGGLDSGMDWVL